MQAKVLIIGAGMAGLTAARRLTAGGCQVALIDKGRGLGGRMATRRMNHTDDQEAQVDHGAQFFTTREAAFAQLANRLLADGTLVEWCRGFEGDDGHSRYCGKVSMNAVAKRLATGLEVHRQQRVTGLYPGTPWEVEMASGDRFRADRIVLTAPVPQALQLLKENNIPFPLSLTEIVYDPCLALLAVLDGPSGLPAPGVMRFDDGPVEWMADNQMKGISPTPTLTLHANPTFSRKHFDINRKAAGAEMLSQVDKYLASSIADWQVHGWRYSKPQKVFPERCLQIQDGLWMAGDGFGAPRVEGAFLSGLAVAEQMLAHLSR